VAGTLPAVRRVTLNETDRAELLNLKIALEQHRQQAATAETALGAKCRELIDTGRGSTGSIAELLGAGYTKSWVHVLATRTTPAESVAISAAPA
jgi:hypothetical protein